jgi:hypothetical protein
MSELSGEQVEALRSVLAATHADRSRGAISGRNCAEAITPTVAAMLDEARTEGAAAVVRDVEERLLGSPFDAITVDSAVRVLRAAHHRHTSTTAGAPR